VFARLSAPPRQIAARLLCFHHSDVA
jgi:hypothetical protein